jgi:FtsP/CotA-like multicopper oxidase with cupredoxin domain
MIVQDKHFDRDGAFDESDHRPTGLLGDTLLVNGAITPYLAVTSQLLRPPPTANLESAGPSAT